VPATQDDLFAFLDSLGIAHSTVSHPAFFTVEEGRPWHDMIPGALEKALGAPRFSFARPEVLMEVLQLTPGSVTPFGLINDTARRATVVLDRDMLASEQVNFHPLRNDASTTIRAADLVTFVRALGYAPVIITVPERLAVAE